MQEIKEFEFENKHEFVNKILKENYFVFHNAIEILLKDNEVQTEKLFYISDNDGSHAYGIWLTGIFFIESFKWNNKLVEKLSELIEFKKFRRFTFIGQRQLLLELLEKNNVNYEIVKDGIIYECVITKNIVAKGNLELVSENDLVEAVDMCRQFYQEEYGIQYGRDINYFQSQILNGIRNKNIYKLIENGQLCSIAQVISQTQNYPIIGLLFTKKNLRSNGYGTSILYQLTKYIHEKINKKCGLFADKSNETSIAVFKKVGYNKVYEQLTVRKENLG